MKKILTFLFIMFISLTCICVNADTYKVRLTYDNVYVRKGPGTNYSSLVKAYANDTFDLMDTNLAKDEKGCSSGWYKIKYNGSAAYVCSSYAVKITITENTTGNATSDCEINLKSKGFPSSYWGSLCSLKSLHPKWNFEANVNGLDFNTAVSKEAVGTKALIDTTYQGYLSTASDAYNYLTDTFVVREGKTWYAASPQVVAYYMDPRNFLSENSIFMFEKLSFDGNYQTLDAISSVLSGRDIAGEKNAIYNASKEFNINAIYLASRIRQETGGNYSNYSLAGNSITLNGVNYSHVYNPYNIGATGGAYDGLVWAVNGSSYLRPWTNLQTAIRGGASFISNSYISQGQDTGYFQKFNTSTYSKYSMYSHQYMTNVRAAASEANISYNGYKSMDLLNNTAFTFVIPVYSNMQTTNYALPSTGNPNNHLKALTVNGNSVANFAHDNYSYTYYVADTVSSVNIGASVINAKAKTSGTGTVNLSGNDNTLTVNVTAENGSVQKYTIRVVKTSSATMTPGDLINQTSLVKSDNYLLFGAGSTVDSLNNTIKKVSSSASVTVNGKTKGALGTGDTITITSGGTSSTLNAVVKGDPTGDGNINIQDLLRIQKYILGYTDLNGSYLKACDNNNDGTCNILDLLRTQKHILGYLTIE